MRIRGRVAIGAISSLFLVVGAAAARAATDTPAALKLPLKIESLTPPAGTTLPSWDTLELQPKTGGRYDVRLSPGADAPSLHDADLSLLVPRVPGLARGNESLTRIALIQREFNRNEVHNPLPDGKDLSIANNCLERGLWEIKLAKSEGGKTVTLFHAWFTFPEQEYARLFREANAGLDYSRYERSFASYPGMGGFPQPLNDLRRVRTERELRELDAHGAQPLERLTEQTNKVKLLRTAGIETYADIVRDEKQPITTAKFSVPGFYDPNAAMTFDLRWLGHPTKILWREVEGMRGAARFPEIEVRFENGYRIVAADSELARIAPRDQEPKTESEVLRLVCGIGTPVIHATAAERTAELSQDRPRYLMLLDAGGNHVDNHLTGVDGLYAWRDTAGRIHLWLVSYERIAFVAHLSARLPDGV
jgi:hypothetical protein